MIKMAINIYHPRDYKFYIKLFEKFDKKFEVFFIIFLDEKISEKKNFKYIYFYKEQSVFEKKIKNISNLLKKNKFNNA